ncbi:DNRLRE domain-containing protein [Pyxidicoccus sp. 3LFB2]
MEFVATHDARIKERLPTTNYGTYSPMCAQIEDGGTDEWVVFKFNTSGLVAPVSRVSLRLYLGVDGGTPHNFRVYNSTNTTWDETVTWNTRPTPGTAFVTVPGGSADNSYFDIDVTPLINPAVTTQTLIIRPVASTDTNALCFVDRASATILKGEGTQPRLVVDYFGAVPVADALVDEAAPTTNAGSATTLGLAAVAPARRAYLQVPISRPLLNDLRGIQLHGSTIPTGVGSPRGRVMLRLYPTTTVAGTSALVYAPPSGTNWSWSETGLTWDNQPAGTGAPNATAIASISNTVAGRWVEVDVTQAVESAIAWSDTLTTTKQELSLHLLLAGGTGTFASKEDPTLKPMLVFISDQLPTVKTDGICGRGEDCASSPTDCGACATGTFRGAYLPVWGDLHRHGLGGGNDGWTAAQIQTHTTNVLNYCKNTEKLDFVALTEHLNNPAWKTTLGFDDQKASFTGTRVTERFVPTMGAEVDSDNGAIESHMKFDIASKAAGTYSAVKLRIKVQNASADGQFKVRRQIRCAGANVLSPLWYNMATPAWSDRWKRSWAEKKDLFPGNIPLETWYDIDVSELLLVNGALYTRMSGDCGTPDPDTLSNVVLAITVGTITTDALGFYTRDSGAANAPRLVFFVDGVEQAGPISTNADQRFDSKNSGASNSGTHSSTEPTIGIDLTNVTSDTGNFSMGHFNILFPPEDVNMQTFSWTNGVPRGWKDLLANNRVYYDYLDDPTKEWYGQINHPFSIDFPLVDMTVATTAVARMATYELSGGSLEQWTNTAYYPNSWQPKINRYLQYVRHGWRVAPAANSDAHCECTSSPCTITDHNCPTSTLAGTRTGMWTLGRNFTHLKQALSQKRAFAVQNGPGLDDKNVYVALQATQSSAFDSSWWMGSVLPNRNAWTLTVSAKNFNDTGTVKINRITLHDDDGYGAIATLQCSAMSSCSGAFNYTPSAANRAVIAVAELSSGHYVVSAPMFF